MKNEIWKNIPGWEDLYQISNMGRIKSLPHMRRHIGRISRIETFFMTKERIFDGTYDAKRIYAC